jgi:aminoglycoside phosphotransferase family enzyme
MLSTIDALILRAFQEGKVEGLKEPACNPQHIRTFISDVFLFPSTVYKIYRKDNQAFNQDFTDLADPVTRSAFYEADFAWNRHFSPSVHQALLGVRVEDGVVRLTPEIDGSFDRVIQMRRIDTAANVTRQLLQGSLRVEDAVALGYQSAKAIDSFPERPTDSLPILEQLAVLMRDVETWCWLADPVFPRALTDAAMVVLRTFIRERETYFSSLSVDDFVIGMDNHSDNIFYEDGQVFFIDVYPPKKEWRRVERSYSVYRMATDIEVFGNLALADAFIQGAQDYYGPSHLLEPSVRGFYQLYSALIKCPYLFILAEKDPARLLEAQLYKAFIEHRLQQSFSKN